MAEETLLVLSEPSFVPASPQPRFLLARALALAALVALAPAVAAAPLKGPVWAELTVDQQQILAPLKPDWDRMDRQPRLKWVGIAKRYPIMTAREQRRIQTRMQRWAALTPEQRAVARNNYRKHVVTLAPEEKKDLQAKWQEYQALPADEKRSLASKAAEPKPAATPKRPAKNTAGPAPPAAQAGPKKDR